MPIRSSYWIIGVIAALLLAVPGVSTAHSGAVTSTARPGSESQNTSQPAPESAVQAKESTSDTKADEEQRSTTRHAITVDGREIAYTATAGYATVELESPDAEARLFFVAYEREGGDRQDRPVTFAFNGGPGASSVWLHLGALGPIRVVLNDDGTLPPPPFEIKQNPLSWLAFTDLVFIDPVGTGFSYAVEDEKEKEGEPKKSEKSFWGVKRDVDSVARFIRGYLSERGRWLSPKFVVGESYGTTRAAALAGHMYDRYGIDLNGLVLVSPALDYRTFSFNEGNNLPFVLYLPSYAAAAHYHGLSGIEGVEPRGSADSEVLPKVLAEVEQFAIEHYQKALSLGGALTPEDRDTLYQQLAALTGLPERVVRRHQGCIDAWTFFKELLADQRLLVGRMDATVTGIDPTPGSRYSGFDPSLQPLSAPFAAGINHYLREDLEFKTDREYQTLNDDVIRNWEWGSGIDDRQGYVDMNDELRQAMSVNPHLKVMLACGYYDLATPYFAAIYSVRQMGLDDRLRPNVEFRFYRAGHMMYTHRDAREQLHRDAQQFYGRALER